MDQALEKRLRELSIYSDFYYRKELKPLSQLIAPGEQLNCILTGVHEGNRKMIAVTDRRIIIIFAPIGTGEVKVVKRSAVQEHWFLRRFLFSEAGFTTENEVFTFTNVQGRLEALFDWAMEQPLP